MVNLMVNIVLNAMVDTVVNIWRYPQIDGFLMEKPSKKTDDEMGYLYDSGNLLMALISPLKMLQVRLSLVRAITIDVYTQMGPPARMMRSFAKVAEFYGLW